jgi:adhesin/invasin
MSRTSRGVSRSLPRLLASALAAVLAVVTGSCDKVPLFAPTESTITLTLNRTTLPVNGTAAVTATVIRSAGHSVQNGTLVTFVSNLGTFDPPEAETEGGRATSTFHAGSHSGTARLTATSGGNRAEEVEVLVGAAAAEHVTVRAEPTSVPVTGGTVQVISVVSDVSGNPLPGAQVIFSSDNGTLSSSSALTDASGEARVSLTTNRETIVRANVAGKEGTATVRATSLPQVTITGPSAPVAAGSPATFALSTPAPNGIGNPIVSIVVDFGDGQSLQVSPGTTSVIHIYNHPGIYTATARATDSAGVVGTSSASVVVQQSPGVDVSITQSPANPVPAPRIVTFTAALPAGISAVSYTWDFGEPGKPSVTTSSSVVQYTYPPGAQTYNVSLTVVTTDGRTGTASRVVHIQ